MKKQFSFTIIFLFLLTFLFNNLETKKSHFCLNSAKNFIKLTDKDKIKECVYTIKVGISMIKNNVSVENKEFFENKNCEKKEFCFSSCLRNNCQPVIFGEYYVIKKTKWNQRFIIFNFFYLLFVLSILIVLVIQQIYTSRNYLKLLTNSNNVNLSIERLKKNSETKTETMQKREINEDELFEQFFEEDFENDINYELKNSDSISNTEIEMKYSIHKKLTK